MVISGVVARVVTEHLEQPWEGAEGVRTLQGQRGSFGRQPSLALSRSVCASLSARRYRSPSTRIKVKVQTLCHSAAASRDGGRARGGSLATGCPKTSRPPTNATVISGLSFCACSGAKRGLLGVCRNNGRILLVNPQVPKIMPRVCRRGRPKHIEYSKLHPRPCHVAIG
jgi:hypothetical protein